MVKSSKTPLFSQSVRREDQIMMNADNIIEDEAELGIIMHKKIVGDNLKTVKGPSKKISMHMDNSRYLRS